MKLFISISGTKFRDPSICDIAYKDIMKIKSVHFIGAKDWLRLPSEELATAFDSPLIIRHPQGHTVPRLDEAAIEQLRGWVAEILQCHNKDLIEKLKNGEEAKMDAKKVREKTNENEKLKNGEAAKMDAEKVQEKNDENEKLKNGEAAKMDAKKVQEKPDEIEKQAEAE
ncbi:hypothetical protein JCGZ_01292 [Jatropha curcas]|uniref:Serine hydrolase domain-containing protein n=1 Tax=Jatropha curcas TaxID=180498 RepID=A0A067L8S6_JATCU|nr:hypothetical protein JCGZ_01292 [Jatropha curcas]